MNPSKTRSDHLKIHVICWAIFIVYESLVAGMMIGQFSPLLHYVFFYSLNISVFYFHAYVVMRWSFSGKNRAWWKLPFFVVLEVLAYIGITILLTYLLEMLNMRKTPIDFNNRYFFSTIWRGTWFILYASGYYFLISFILRSKEELKKAIEIEQLNGKLIRAEIDFLRSQINPHLLFNTLNFVKYAAKRNPEQSDEAIVRLSQIMSFAMGNTADGLVLVKDELEQIENIIQLNRLRFGGKLQVHFHQNLKNKDLQIIPIILLTLTENVFKHGYLLDPNFPAEISFQETEEGIEFKTRNLIQEGVFTEASSHKGLSNILSRLESTYGDKFTFDHGKEDRHYTTSLFILF